MEEWKKIPKFYNYSISNYGRVRNNTTLQILKPIKDINGYYRVNIRNYNKPYNFLIHRLVISVFNPVKDMKKMQVDHINRKRDDNRIENLRWITRKENCQNRKYTSKKKQQCFDENFNYYESYRDAERKTGVSANTIKNDVLEITQLFRCNTNKQRPKFFKTIDKVNEYWRKTYENKSTRKY